MRHLRAGPGVVLFCHFCCMLSWQWSLPGMPDWHRKTPRQSEELCYPSSDLVCFLVPLPVPVKSVPWADTGRGVRAQVFPCPAGGWHEEASCLLVLVMVGLGIHGIETFSLKLHFLSAPSGSWCRGYVAVIPLAHTNIALKERLWEQRVDHFVSQQTTKSA